MKAIDTNVLVRFLIKDDEAQAAEVKQLFEYHESIREPLFVPALVVLELIWVLQAAYGVSRADITSAITDLLAMTVLNFEQQTAVRKFVMTAKSSSFDLPDLLIAISAKEQDCQSVLTFDKKASKFQLFELVGS